MELCHQQIAIILYFRSKLRLNACGKFTNRSICYSMNNNNVAPFAQQVGNFVAVRFRGAYLQWLIIYRHWAQFTALVEHIFITSISTKPTCLLIYHLGNGQKRPAEAPAENEPPQKRQKVEQQQHQAQPQQPQQPQHQYNDEPMDWE